MLKENINKQINSLNEKLNIYNPIITDEFINDLERFSNLVLNNEEELVRIDNIDLYLSQVYENNDELNNYKEQLNTLKKLIKSKLECDEEELKQLFELSNEQKDFIKNVCLDINKYLETAKVKLEERKAIEKDLKIYTDILDKLNKNEKMDINDLKVLELNLNEEKVNDQFNMYKEFIIHNETI